MVWLKRMKLLCCNYFSYCILQFPLELFSAALLITVATLMWSFRHWDHGFRFFSGHGWMYVCIFWHVCIVVESTCWLHHVCPSLRLSVCLSVHMHQQGFHWMDFCEIWYWGTSVVRMEQKIRHFTWRLDYISFWDKFAIKALFCNTHFYIIDSDS